MRPIPRTLPTARRYISAVRTSFSASVNLSSAGAGKASYGSRTPNNSPIARASAPAVRPAISLSATVFSSAAMRRSCASFFATSVPSMVSTFVCHLPKGEAAN